MSAVALEDRALAELLRLRELNKELAETLAALKICIASPQLRAKIDALLAKCEAQP